MTPIQELHDNAVDDLIVELDVDEYMKIFSQQIQNDDNDYTTPEVDQYTPLYKQFMTVMDMDDIDDDKRREAITRFENISYSIIDSLNKKFNLDIDEEQLGETDGLFYGYVLACYKFFVIDFQNNIIQLMTSYISRHMTDLYEQFAALDQKKDVVTMSNKKVLSPKLAILASNIYDVTDYIFSLIDENNIMDYMEEGDIVALSIKEMLKKDLIHGDFAVAMADIYKENVDLKARVCLKIVLSMKEGKIYEDTSAQSESAKDEEESTEEE